ncbi:tubulin monoglutamylase TTLL4-like isoform X2 [Corticium candelabrum]|nr:tubulin monoglutamylase TTLL4-like isoform X2 [Corticium candelabrum]
MLAQKTENAASPSCLERSEIERIQIITVTPAAKTKQMWRDEQNGRSAISGLRLPPGALQETVRYQSEGPRPPLAYIRPLCASDACRSRSGATLENIFVSHALNVTYKESDPWNLLISNANQGVPVIKQYWQKTNIFPGMLKLCLKEQFCKVVQKTRELFVNMYNKTLFAVDCFIWPEDKETVYKVSSLQSNIQWLVRPAGSYRNSLATGFIVANGAKLNYSISKLLDKFTQKEDMNSANIFPVTLVQMYIHQPFLINSRKHTMRLYLLIKSFDPLEMYLSHYGEVFFAAHPFQQGKEHLNDTCMQFDVTSVTDCLSEETVSLYWTLQNYWFVLKKTGRGKDRDILWSKIRSVATHAGLMVASSALSFWSKTYDRTKLPGKAYWESAYSLLALEIQIDESKQPWLVGINCDPGLAHLGSYQRNSLKAKLMKTLVDDYLSLNGDFADNFKYLTDTDGVSNHLRVFCQQRGGCTAKESYHVLSYENAHRANVRYEVLFPRPAMTGSQLQLWRSFQSSNSVLVQWALYKKMHNTQ